MTVTCLATYRARTNRCLHQWFMRPVSDKLIERDIQREFCSLCHVERNPVKPKQPEAIKRGTRPKRAA